MDKKRRLKLEKKKLMYKRWIHAYKDRISLIDTELFLPDEVEE